MHHFAQLKDKWTNKHRELKHKVLTKHLSSVQWLHNSFPAKRHIAATAISAMMLLTPAASHLPTQSADIGQPQIAQTTQMDKRRLVAIDLASTVPRQVRPLSSAEEKEIVSVLSDDLDMNLAAEMNGIRLNRNYGLIGGEQHLARYPGDVIANHGTNEEERRMFLPSGMAPGLGAWRYFANSQSAMTQQDIEREKYYLAAPTFLAPGFNENVSEYRDFFKYRKMLVVNPKTGSAVVAVIGDAGLGQSTGKHLGGSPEVMHYLDLGTGPRKGAVLYFFIDDPNDTIPLGPVR